MDFTRIGYDISSAQFTGTFNQPRKFWEFPTGVGLAQFTNANFVSAGTNFDTNTFNFPLFTPALRSDMDIQQLCATANPPCPNPNLKGTMTFYGNWVDDRYTGQKMLNPMASTHSVFDAELKKAKSKNLFTLNRFNFEVAHGFLTTRAVAYSAGLINYFFRGKIDMQRDRDNFLAYRIQNLGKEMMNGTFRLYYDDEQNNRHLVKTWTGVTIDAGSEKGNFTFDAPTNPKPKNPDEYLLVFAGEMGQERPQGNSPGAVVSAVVKAKPFVFFSGWRIDTDTDPIWSGSLMLFNYTIPEDLLLEFQNNFATIEMFIDDVLIPRTWISQGGCHSNLYCPSVFGQTADFVMEWQVQTMMDNGFVVHHGSSYSTVGYGLADWDNLHPEVCGRVLSSNGFYFLNYSPWVPHKMKLMISGKLAFEFMVEQGPNFQAVLSQTKNVRIHTKQCRLALKP